MHTHIVKILKLTPLTPDVKSFVTTKPKDFLFTSGQATSLSINKPEFINQKRPFTFASAPSNSNLEFIIKAYFDRISMTQEIHKLVVGDELVISSPWGAISYKGKGVFIAGGAGVTPFISIFRDLAEKGEMSGNSLIFSNKTSQDVILEEELRQMFNSAPDALDLVLTREEKLRYSFGRITKEYLVQKIQDFSQHFYICGPKAFVEDIRGYLKDLGASSDELVFER